MAFLDGQTGIHTERRFGVNKGRNRPWRLLRVDQRRDGWMPHCNRRYRDAFMSRFVSLFCAFAREISLVSLIWRFESQLWGINSFAGL